MANVAEKPNTIDDTIEEINRDMYTAVVICYDQMKESVVTQPFMYMIL